MTCFPSDTCEQYITLASPVSRGLSEITHFGRPQDPPLLPDWVRSLDMAPIPPTGVPSPPPVPNRRACRRGRAAIPDLPIGDRLCWGSLHTAIVSGGGICAKDLFPYCQPRPSGSEVHPPVAHFDTRRGLPRNSSTYRSLPGGCPPGLWSPAEDPVRPKETLAIGLLTDLAEV